MRKHGWQLPYHPLQVVAIAVILALGFAFYVFFAPFVGSKMHQYIVIAIYTPLITVVFGLYIWCAAADPADPGVFKSKKYLKIPDSKMVFGLKNSKLGEESTPSMHDAKASTVGGNSMDNEAFGTEGNMKDTSHSVEKENPLSSCLSHFLLVCSPCAYICRCSGSNEESSDKQISEEGMFYCSLCEVEVFKYSKHCRVCDKCVNHFDHHCRWLNNCIGKKNYRQFFSLMIAAILLFILQWSTGILVLICCFLERKQFSMEISSKLGSSFSLAPFVIVVSACTILAMIATLPVVQLFFFHILLIKKGLSTYDYIVAMRELEQEQEQLGVGGQQSPQMSTVSSFTALSSVSSFNALHRGAWCTPPRMFLENQDDVVPPETGSVSSLGKKSMREEPLKKKNPATVKISPWTLARLNAEEVAKAAAEVRKKSKILQPVIRHDQASRLEPDIRFGSSGRRTVPTIENNKTRDNKHIYLPADISMESMTNVSFNNTNMGFIGRSGFAPPHLRSFQTSQAMSSSAGIVLSSPESSLDSPDIHTFRATGADEARHLAGLSTAGAEALKEIPLSRSTSDGYEASGGEDSDQVPSRVVQRIADWSSVLFRADQDERAFRPTLSSSMSHSRH
ncbi:putative S-acyltransferase [Trifolium pratense]|uniref:S-acyltransferase n=1 Tax=Trifolium pratense TaxID=57577 RepID=A0A2K3NPS5_TRIPR|nr:probable protein S-acyltransferase 22 [Trifolium pratense]PNY05041.1 putative S-acyltransferase [Trifolium pratense]